MTKTFRSLDRGGRRIYTDDFLRDICWSPYLTDRVFQSSRVLQEEFQSIETFRAYIQSLQWGNSRIIANRCSRLTRLAN